MLRGGCRTAVIGRRILPGVRRPKSLGRETFDNRESTDAADTDADAADAGAEVGSRTEEDHGWWWE